MGRRIYTPVAGATILHIPPGEVPLMSLPAHALVLEGAPVSRPEPPLPRTPVLLVVALTIVTLGFYIPIWYLRRLKAFNALRSTTRLSAALPFTTLALLVVRLSASAIEGILAALGATPLATVLSAYGTLVDLGYIVVMLVLAFRARDVLQDHLRARLADDSGAASVALQSQVYSLSGVWTFLFNTIYLQLKINEFHRELTSAPDAMD
jgi:hypothetical protein